LGQLLRPVLGVVVEPPPLGENDHAGPFILRRVVVGEEALELGAVEFVLDDLGGYCGRCQSCRRQSRGHRECPARHDDASCRKAKPLAASRWVMIPREAATGSSKVGLGQPAMSAARPARTSWVSGKA